MSEEMPNQGLLGGVLWCASSTSVFSKEPQPSNPDFKRWFHLAVFNDDALSAV
jgi:hypothetical protein